MPDNRFPEPEPDDWEPPSREEIYKPAPLDVKPYQPVLTPLDIPPYPKPPTDHTSDVPHWAPGSGRPMDDLRRLTVEQEIDLLNKNHIYLSTKQVSLNDESGFGAMDAYVVSDIGLQPAPGFTPAVRFTKVKLHESQRGLNQNTAYSYNEFESHLQRQLATESTVEVGIPKVFKVNTDFGYASSTATHAREVEIHFSANKWIAGAEVVFDVDDITLETSFVEKVRKIMGPKPSTDSSSSAGPAEVNLKAENLLAHLAQYGEFVPLTRLLGGRMSLTEETKLKDSSTFETTKLHFGLAADARFKINSVPGQAGGGNGTGYWTTNDQARIEQAKVLKMKCVGGNEKLADTNPTHLGGEWIDSVAPYNLWRTIGFAEKTFVPIIDFLPDDLRPRVWSVLRGYFHNRLHSQNTELAGHQPAAGNKAFEANKLNWPKGVQYNGKPFNGNLEKISRGPSQIVVNAEGNVDNLELSYRVYGVGDGIVLVTGASYGNGRKNAERTIDLAPGEDIRKLEVWIDPDVDKGVLRSLAITTSKGIRYPDRKGFFGSNPKPGQTNPQPGKYIHGIIEAPRVRALYGNYGSFVHAIGLTYLDLDANTKSRGFLLALEPFLYPTGDYGPLY
jgi:hypothetical protein